MGARGARLAYIAALAFVESRASIASASTLYRVGPGRPYPDLQSVAPLLRPGDQVEVDGGVSYAGGVIFRESGTDVAPIRVVGRPVGRRRPVLVGGRTGVEFRGDHYVFEGFEVTGASARCLYHHGSDLTVRDTVVHDCNGHGVLGADEGSGSLTLSYVEVYHAGRGDSAHPIYIASDEEAHPGSVFRMEHCYVHDNLGGNNVKSRAERNELYANWIEGALYHEVELIGPDNGRAGHRREDSDVVGNVIRKTRPGFAVRVGGDGSGESNGRYRFVNNTVILVGPRGAALRLYNGLESLEAHNNAFVGEGGGGVVVVAEDDVHWAAGHPVIMGSYNWLPTGSSGVPTAWVHTLYGRDPGFVSSTDLRPAPGSPLIAAGSPAPRAARGGFEFPSPLAVPRDLPPPRTLEAVGTARLRLRGAVDIGALSFDPGTAGAASLPDPPSPQPPADGRPPPRPWWPAVPPSQGCGCRSPTAASAPVGITAIAGLTPLGLAAVGSLRRHRKRRRTRET